MLLGLLKSYKLLYFAGGVVAAAATTKLLKSEKAKKLCVQGLAKGMKLKQDALVAFQNIKEEAADICHDAAKEAGPEE